jgi:hypothetical protein
MVMFLESADRSQRFPLDRESIFIGSSAWKSDICLTGPGIQGVHCELTLLDRGVRVVALADSGVSVNNETVREATLFDGDDLGIAQLRFRLTSGANEAASELPTAQNVVSPAAHVPVATSLSRWMVRLGGLNLGPLDWEELQAMIGRGEVRLDDDVQRENESTWQPLRNVIPRSGGDALLCDDASTELVDQPVRRPRSRRQAKKSHSFFEEVASTLDTGSSEVDVAADELLETEVPLAPQFFILRGSDEIGPLPRQAIQELANEGSIQAESPVRVEDTETWTTAAAVGIHCSATEPANQGVAPGEVSRGWQRAAGIVWLILAPYYFMTGLVRVVAGLDPRRVAIWGVIVLVVGVVAFRWL